MARDISRDVAANLPAALRAIGRPLAYPKDGWVFRKGDAVRAIFLVLDGEVRLLRFAKDGSEIALHSMGVRAVDKGPARVPQQENGPRLRLVGPLNIGAPGRT